MVENELPGGGGPAAGGAGGAAPAAAAPAAPASASGGVADGGSSGGVAAGQQTPPYSPPPAANAGEGQGQGQAASLSVRDALANYGLDLRGQFQDDHAALQYMALQMRQAQQAQQLAQYGQLYVQHADQFQRFLTQQQEEQRRQQQQPGWWNAPQYDPTWSQKIMRDPTTGELRAVPGAPPDTVQKYLQWVEHQKTFLDRFSQDPIGAIRPGIEEVVQQVAQRMLQQQMYVQQDQQVANEFLRQNADWLYAKDQSGQVLANPQTGQPMLSEYGRRFAYYVNEAEQMGLSDSSRQQQYAMRSLQRDYLMQIYQQQGQQQQQVQAPSPQQQANQQFLQQAAARNGVGGPVPPAGNVQGSVPVQPSQRGLEEMLARNLAAAGFGPGQTLE